MERRGRGLKESDGVGGREYLGVMFQDLSVCGLMFLIMFHNLLGKSYHPLNQKRKNHDPREKVPKKKKKHTTERMHWSSHDPNCYSSDHRLMYGKSGPDAPQFPGICDCRYVEKKKYIYIK